MSFSPDFSNNHQISSCNCSQTIGRREQLVLELTEQVRSSRVVQKKLDILVEEINSLRADQKVTHEKMWVLVEASSEQTATIKGLTKQHGQGQQVAKQFPIQTVESLKELNTEINNTNRELYIDAIRIHIMTGGILKNLKNILANPVVLAYNVDGVQGKAALKKDSAFYDVLIDEINLVDGNG